MPITKLEQDTVSNGAAACKLILNQVYPACKSLDILYAGTGDVKNSLTQIELDSVASFSGLTKQQVDDAMFVLGTLKTNIEAGYTALAILAGRS